MNITDRYRQLLEQAAYRRRVKAFGLSALLAPYRGGLPACSREVEQADEEAPVAA